jgi:spore coat polysaccharide biosynthesis protein SpsF (cytidylyltransferase family)
MTATATERQWVAFLKACKTKRVLASRLRDDVARVLNADTWQALTAAQVGVIIRLVNDCPLQGEDAVREFIEAALSNGPRAA